ncbi:MAG: ATP-binding cassette domain-containing protein [Ilumatobacteraceae bacterium]
MPVAPTPLFEFRRVGLTIGGTRILQDVDLVIPERGITVVVGPSGSGKSTLLRCCNRLETPTAGTITYRGDDLAELPPRTLRRRVAMVFQAPVVFPGTPLDNLRAADPALGTDEGCRLLERVGLNPDLLERSAERFSGGEAQRLCIARALATEPETLLADECTSALDPDSAEVVEQLARRLADDGMPIVWVTHSSPNATAWPTTSSLSPRAGS